MHWITLTGVDGEGNTQILLRSDLIRILEHNRVTGQTRIITEGEVQVFVTEPPEVIFGLLMS